MNLVVSLLYFSHLNWFAVISDCGFTLHFPNGWDVEHVFIYLSVSPLWWNVSSCLLPIFKLCCFYSWILRVLYILGTGPLSYIWLPNIFSQPIILPFHPLNSVFCRGKVFNFDVICFFFSLVALAFGVMSKKPLPHQRPWRIMPMFLLKFL